MIKIAINSIRGVNALYVLYDTAFQIEVQGENDIRALSFSPVRSCYYVLKEFVPRRGFRSQPSKDAFQGTIIDPLTQLSGAL